MSSRAEKRVKFTSGDLFAARQKVADHHVPEAVCVSGFASAARKPKTPHILMPVPLNPHEFLNPEDVPKAPLGSTGVLSTSLEVRPEVKGGCLLSAHS